MSAPRPGLVQVYTGDGKGKTTAALGLALQAVGHGLRVIMVQFMKGGGTSGEVAAAQSLAPYLLIRQFGYDCARRGTPACRHCGTCFRENRNPAHGYAPAALAYARRVCRDGAADMLILDEIAPALRHGLRAGEEVSALVAAKPAAMERVLTGRHMPPEIVAQADLVTECRAVKHPLAAGVPARAGIEY